MAALTNLTFPTTLPTSFFSLPYFTPSLVPALSSRTPGDTTKPVTATAVMLQPKSPSPPGPPKANSHPIFPSASTSTTEEPRKTKYFGIPVSWITSTITVLNWRHTMSEAGAGAGVAGGASAMETGIAGVAMKDVNDEDDEIDFDALVAAALATATAAVPGVSVPTTLATITRPSTSASSSAPSATISAAQSAENVDTQIHQHDRRSFPTFTFIVWEVTTITGIAVTQTGVVTLQTGATMPSVMTGAPVLTAGGQW